MTESGIMVNCSRKWLVWDLKRDLVILPADKLFHIAKGLGPIPGHDTTELDLEDSEVCFTCGRRNI